jgi:5-methylcytosine-specific restriction endonuclease McrA
MRPDIHPTSGHGAESPPDLQIRSSQTADTPRQTANGMAEQSVGKMCPECGHTLRLVRRKTTNERFFYQVVCLHCLYVIETQIGHDRGRRMALKWPVVDIDSCQWQEMNRRKAEARNDAHARHDAGKQDWRVTYAEHLSSEYWRDIRRKVLRRDDGLCQACLERPATQVHHLTYGRLGREAAFDLVSICDRCHADLHGKEDAS